MYLLLYFRSKDGQEKLRKKWERKWEIFATSFSSEFPIYTLEFSLNNRNTIPEINRLMRDWLLKSFDLRSHWHFYIGKLITESVKIFAIYDMRLSSSFVLKQCKGKEDYQREVYHCLVMNLLGLSLTNAGFPQHFVLCNECEIFLAPLYILLINFV